MDLIAKPLEIIDAPDAKPLVYKGGTIEFDKVSFHYDRKDGILDNLSLEIRAGEKIGIVGHSGSGKTTLVSLLPRFFDPLSGVIRFDGQDIAKVTQDSLRAQFSLVQQDVQLFHRSVSENIAYGMNNVDPGDIIRAAKRAGAHDFIETLEDNNGRKGYDARWGSVALNSPAGSVSVIVMARAILRNVPVLILDEATSQLDSAIETGNPDQPA